MIFRIPIDRINWTTSAFLIGTLFLTLTAVPLYLWYFGFDWFHFAICAVLGDRDRIQHHARLSPVVYARDVSRTVPGAFVHAHLRRGGL